MLYITWQLASPDITPWTRCSTPPLQLRHRPHPATQSLLTPEIVACYGNNRNGERTKNIFCIIDTKTLKMFLKFLKSEPTAGCPDVLRTAVSQWKTSTHQRQAFSFFNTCFSSIVISWLTIRSSIFISSYYQCARVEIKTVLISISAAHTASVPQVNTHEQTEA